MESRLTVSDLGTRLGLTDKAVRAKLRALAVAGDALVSGHQHGQPWVFTAAGLDALVAKLTGERAPNAAAAAAAAVAGPAPRSRAAGGAATADALRTSDRGRRESYRHRTCRRLPASTLGTRSDP